MKLDWLDLHFNVVVGNMFYLFEHLDGWSWTTLDGLDLLFQQHQTLCATYWIHLNTWLDEVGQCWAGLIFPSNNIKQCVKHVGSVWTPCWMRLDVVGWGSSSLPTIFNIVRNMFDPFEHVVGWSGTALKGLHYLLEQHPTLYATCWIHLITLYDDVWTTLNGIDLHLQQHPSLYATCWIHLNTFFINEVGLAWSSFTTLNIIVGNIFDSFEHVVGWSWTTLQGLNLLLQHPGLL